MWVSRYTSAPRVILRRIILLLASVITVAMFAVGGLLAQPVWAADAVWEGSNIRYNSQVYVPESTADPPVPLSDSDPRGMAGHYAYTWIETLPSGTERAHTIFLDEDFDRASGVTGSHISFTHSSPGSYTSPSPTRTMTIEADLTAVSTSDEAPSECHSDVFDSLGWALCSVSRVLARVVDTVYGMIRDFLEVPAVTADSSSGLYTIWGIVRSVANVAFIIAIMIIVYSQITSVGISNYGIKTMLPRIIIAAIFVNISFWLTALAVDISNVLGHSVHAVLENTRNNLPDNVDVDWSKLTYIILSAGAFTGGVAIIGAVAGSFAGLGFLLLSALLTVAFGAFVAFVILAARQAILTILIVIAPLAMVAYILPSTQNLFDKWRKSFVVLLMFFPLFGLLFGGASLAGSIIMNNADGRLHIVLIGLTVQVVPLVLTPLMIRFSTGILGKVASITSSKHGAVDRAKGWARNNAEYQKDKALGQRRTYNPLKGLARWNDRNDKARENRRAGYKANADMMARGNYDRKTGAWRSRRNWEKSDRFKRQTEGDLATAQERDKARFTDLQAGINTYQDPLIDVRGNARRVLNPAIRAATSGRSEGIRSREAVTVDPATRLAQETAIASLHNAEASRAVSEIVNARILADQELQKRATGAAGNADIMLAGLVTKEREDYGKKVNAQDQLMRHFALDAGQYQKLAMKQEDISVAKRDKDGNVTSSYTFKIDDEYTREAAIEHQLAAGSAGEKRKIINESGRQVLVRNADGTYETRVGVNYDHRTTIQDAVIKHGVSKAIPYINDKSFNQIIKGEWKGEISEYGNAMREILEGRLKAESLASANDGALNVIYNLQDLRTGSLADRDLFEQYKSHALEIIRDTSSDADYRNFRDNFDAMFDKNFLDIRKEAGKVLDDPDLSSRAAKSSRDVLERYRTPKPSP